MNIHSVRWSVALSSLALFSIGLSGETIAQGASPTQSDPFPTRAVRFLVPFPPGGAADVFARTVGQKLSEDWGQPVVVENKPGAGGRIATQTLASSPADGYTMLVVTVGHAVNPALYGSLPYDTERDMTPVAMLARLPSALVVNAALPVKSVSDLIQLAAAQPGKISYASSGNATTSHVAGALLAKGAGIDLLHVPYKGSAPALTDLISGQVSFMIDPIATAMPHVRSGKLRAIAVSSASRSPLAPDLPTIAESGIKDYDFSAWFLLLAPAKVPEAIVVKVNAAVGQAVSSEALKKNFSGRGAEAGSGSPAELRAFLSREIRRYRELVQATGMKAD
jgi:tripartite-type tricarboxylate transporter receptor subunit TctC